MKKLNEKSWKKFSVFGDKGFLCISTTSSSIDGIRLIEGNDKNVPYITRSGAGNGLARFVSEKNCELGSDEANCITVGLDTQTAFYQPHKFVTGQNIHIVTGESINQYSALFYVTILRNQMIAKFNWGGNGATLGRMERLEALLPVTSSNTPDYNYMSEYIQQKQVVLLNRYIEFVKNRIFILGKGMEIPELNNKKWSEFPLGEIFTVDSGKRLETRNKISGTRPFIGAADNNNGVTGFVGNINPSKDSNVLGVNYNGAPCIAFYHPYECIFSDDVKRLHLRDYKDNKYVLLFFVEIFAKQKSKYNYGYKFNSQRMLRQKLMLPVNDTGEPDYAYMEQYSKNMMLKKYKQYLAFLDRKQGKT